MKIAIVGSDINALMAAFVARRRGHQFKMYSQQQFGWRRPYIIYESSHLKTTLNEMGIEHSSYRIRSGIMLRGQIEPFPRVLRGCGKKQGARIRGDLFSKTRLVQSDQPSKSSLDYEISKTKMGMVFEWPSFLEVLTRGIQIDSSPVTEIRSDCIVLGDREEFFDLAIVTLPLWRCAELVQWPLPHACSISLNTAIIDSNSAPDVREQLAGWDYVWTPYTPDGLVHRVYQVNESYHVQFSGAWNVSEDKSQLIGDLNYLFPAGWAPLGSHRGEAGFLCPLSEKAIWPKSVLPMGRLARWDARATLSQTFDDLLKVLR
jgi:hypothetical protein